MGPINYGRFDFAGDGIVNAHQHEIIKGQQHDLVAYDGSEIIGREPDDQGEQQGNDQGEKDVLIGEDDFEEPENPQSDQQVERTEQEGHGFQRGEEDDDLPAFPDEWPEQAVEYGDGTVEDQPGDRGVYLF